MLIIKHAIHIKIINSLNSLYLSAECFRIYYHSMNDRSGAASLQEAFGVRWCRGQRVPREGSFRSEGGNAIPCDFCGTHQAEFRFLKQRVNTYQLSHFQVFIFIRSLKPSKCFIFHFSSHSFSHYIELLPQK
uniref:Uncharacterized protein n=1 Tax=Anguilla anguilla TaxID=7936 RepID=A0A0E9X8J6_ANGAN